MVHSVEAGAAREGAMGAIAPLMQHQCQASATITGCPVRSCVASNCRARPAHATQEENAPPCWQCSRVAVGRAPSGERVNSAGARWRPHATQWMCSWSDCVVAPGGGLLRAFCSRLVSRFSRFTRRTLPQAARLTKLNEHAGNASQTAGKRAREAFALSQLARRSGDLVALPSGTTGGTTAHVAMEVARARLHREPYGGGLPCLHQEPLQNVRARLTCGALGKGSDVPRR
jgi:hypothetical protein